MTKQEFIDFCHEEFVKRGFKKKGKTYYYLKGKDLLCGIYLQKSMSEAFYVNFYYCIGEYNDKKMYPKIYDSDISRRVVVWSKDTFKGEHFWDALIDYEEYTVEEIKPYFSAFLNADDAADFLPSSMAITPLRMNFSRLSFNSLMIFSALARSEAAELYNA